MTLRVYKKYLLGILVLAHALNYQDRWALSLVLQQIKIEYALSDTQLGLMNGIAFALFYSLMGVPIARWADRGNRIRVLALSLALWSLMVALTGLATNFVELLLFRAGAAIGEAGCFPVAYSLIPNYFTREERPRATAVFLSGGALSFVTGYLLAGWLNAIYGWHVMFVILALPGIGVAALAASTLREPRSNDAGRSNPNRPEKLQKIPSLRQVAHTLSTNTTFRYLLFNFIITAFFTYGTIQWQVTFFVRSYNLDVAELGFWFAGIYGICGLIGTYLGGSLATRYAPYSEDIQLKAMAICYLGQFTLFSTMYFAGNVYVAFVMLGMSCIAGTTINAPVYAIIQSLVPERMRAQSIAVLYLCTNLMGMGFGPLAVGALSDMLQPVIGAESLRYALLASCPMSLWAGWFLWRGSRSVIADLEIHMPK